VIGSGWIRMAVGTGRGARAVRRRRRRWIIGGVHAEDANVKRAPERSRPGRNDAVERHLALTWPAGKVEPALRAGFLALTRKTCAERRFHLIPPACFRLREEERGRAGLGSGSR